MPASNLREAIYAADSPYNVSPSASDNAAKLQSAFDDATYVKKTTLILPPGVLHTSRTIYAGGVGLATLHVRGQGRAYAGSPYFGGTIIQVDHCSGPAIAVGGMRQATFEGFTLLGMGASYIDASSPMTVGIQPAWDGTVGSNWVDPAILTANPAADSQFAPYAGVSIDSEIRKAPSSNVLLRNMNIYGFVVGVVMQPWDNDENGDYLGIEDCDISKGRYGISVGNRQSRSVALNRVTYSSLHTFLTTAAHGRQSGKLGGAMTNVRGGFSYQLLDIDTAGAGSPTFYNLYFESQYRIGNIGGASSNARPLRFIGGEQHFLTDQFRPGTRDFLIGGAPGKVKFSEVIFAYYASPLTMNVSSVQLDDCILVPQ